MGRVGIRYAIVMCEEAEAACPKVYPFATQTLYWPFSDPAAAAGDDSEKLRAFREVMHQIEGRIRSWLSAG